MSYQVLARKWRPKNFKELLGQNSARQTLTNALAQNRLYPVLIFTGPRGTGKTSTARIVAKSLRCQNKKPDGSPCGTCEDCLAISTSRHLDVIEIDGASNNGVEAIRDLRDKVSYMPSSGDWKVYIIDEVHMLSNSAFNALLKTLEEPPKHVVFILATTEIHKIPSTVLSRCQKIDFHLLSPLIIKQHLEKICETENFSLSDQLLWILARQAQGSLRDAQSLLDQVITFCGDSVKEEELRRLLGLSEAQILEDLLKTLILREEAHIVPLIAKLRNKSSTPKNVLQDLLSSVSHLLFLKKNPENDPPLLPLSKEELERKKELASLISYERLHFLFDILLKGEKEMSLSYDSEMVLEVLLLRVCSAPQIEEIMPFSQKNQPAQNPAPQNSSSKPASPEKEKLLGSRNPQTGGGNGKEKPGGNERRLTAPPKDKTAPAPLKSSFSKKPPVESPLKPLAPSNLTAPPAEQGENSFENRLEFLDYIKKKDPLLGSLIDHLSFKRKSELEFIVCVPKNFPYLKNQLEQQEIQKKLERELALFLNLNQKAKLFCRLEERLDQSLSQEKDKNERETLLKRAEDSPFIQDLKHVFKGKIQSVKKIDKKREEV